MDNFINQKVEDIKDRIRMEVLNVLYFIQKSSMEGEPGDKWYNNKISSEQLLEAFERRKEIRNSLDNYDILKNS